MGIQAMNIHHLARALIWDHHEPPSLPLGCKRLRPLAPKLTTTAATATTTTATNTAAVFDLKSFIRPESGPREIGSLDSQKKDSAQGAGARPGGTRWNPTQEQIGILELLYANGMRTPNAQQIEQITDQLGKYGKIEGKNVFYWFQNHKARERQKQKRISLGLSRSSRTPPPSPFTTSTSLLSSSSSSTKSEGMNGELFEDNPYKRKCRSWGFDVYLQEDNKWCTADQEGKDRTLELFPLHPEGRS